MEISTKSWHYRFLAWCGKEPWMHKTMCDYMLSLIYCLTLRPVLIAVGITFVVALCVASLWAAYQVVYLMFWLPVTSVAGYEVDAHTLWLISRLWMFIGTFAMFVILIFAFGKNGIVGVWLKDRKEKTCTRITFK